MARQNARLLNNTRTNRLYNKNCYYLRDRMAETVLFHPSRSFSWWRVLRETSSIAAERFWCRKDKEYAFLSHLTGGRCRVYYVTVHDESYLGATVAIISLFCIALTFSFVMNFAPTKQYLKRRWIYRCVSYYGSRWRKGVSFHRYYILRVTKHWKTKRWRTVIDFFGTVI